MNKKELLLKWQGTLRITQVIHYKSSAYYRRLHWIVGIIAIAFSSIAGASIFSFTKTSPDTDIRIIFGFISITAAFFAGLQTFLRLGELAEKHRMAGVKYGVVRRNVEEYIVIFDSEGDIDNEKLRNIREKWGDIEHDSPSFPQSLSKKVREEIYNSEERYFPNKT